MNVYRFDRLDRDGYELIMANNQDEAVEEALKYDDIDHKSCIFQSLYREIHEYKYVYAFNSTIIEESLIFIKANSEEEAKVEIIESVKKNYMELVDDIDLAVDLESCEYVCACDEMETYYAPCRL